MGRRGVPVKVYLGALKVNSCRDHVSQNSILLLMFSSTIENNRKPLTSSHRDTKTCSGDWIKRGDHNSLTPTDAFASLGDFLLMMSSCLFFHSNVMSDIKSVWQAHHDMAKGLLLPWVDVTWLMMFSVWTMVWIPLTMDQGSFELFTHFHFWILNTHINYHSNHLKASWFSGIKCFHDVQLSALLLLQLVHHPIINLFFCPFGGHS